MLMLGSRKKHRQQLRVAIRHVQQRHIAESGDVIHRLPGTAGIRLRPGAQAHATDRTRTQYLEKFAFVQVHVAHPRMGLTQKTRPGRV